MEKDMRFRKIFLLALLLLSMPMAVKAQFDYITNGNAITITKYTGNVVVVTVPDTINGLPVTRIGVGAFGGSSVFSVTIGTNVTSIGHNPFTICTHLASFTIPDNVTSIEDYAFLACYSLASVTIGTNVTSIGSQAFHRCTSLTSVAIPNGVTRIGTEAFASCTNLTIVTIPGSVTSIGIGGPQSSYHSARFLS